MRNEIRHLRPVLSVLTLVWFAAAVPAQDPFGAPATDPFGNVGPAAGSPFGGPATAASSGTSEPVELALPDPLIEELRLYAKGSVQRLAIAIRSAVQISDWEEAKSYVDILGGQAPSPADAATIANIIKPHYLLRLQQHPSLSAGQRDVVRKIFSLSKQYAEDVGRIKAAIAKLDDPDRGVRSSAMRVVRNGGVNAIAELAATYVADTPASSRASLLDALRRFQPDSFQAMEQFAVYGEPATREHALQCVMELDLRRSLPDLVSAYHASDQTPQERTTAATGLSQLLNGMPTPHEAHLYLQKALTRAVDFVNQVPHDPQTRRIWQLSDDKRAVQPITITNKNAYLRGASIAAQRYLRLSSANSDGTVEALSAKLAYLMAVDPTFGTTSSGYDSAILEQVIRRSIERREEYATVAAIRLLGRQAAISAVASDGAQRKLLVKCSIHPSPRVRYEAANALAQIGYDRGYSGSSDTMHRWIEMSNLNRRPTAIILNARKNRTRRSGAWLESLGYAVEVVPTVAQLLKRLDKGGDIQLLIANSQPADRQITETVDAVRRHQFGGNFPILIHCQPAKTIWDEDLREPIYNPAGFLIAAPKPAPGQPDPANDKEDLYGIAPEEILQIPVPNGISARLADIDKKHQITQERMRIQGALGQRWPAPLTVVEHIESATQLSQSILAMVEQLPMPPLHSQERLIYANRGVAHLEKIVGSKNQQILYDLLSHEEEVVQAVRQGGFTPAGLSLLSGIGSRESQVLLANLAAGRVLPSTKRQKAAEAFAVSIERFGTRLNREEVSLQYDRFNTATEQADQAVLSIILDALEKRVNATTR